MPLCSDWVLLLLCLVLPCVVGGEVWWWCVV
nr:MAG TPA: hypothetical protein [Caudoviricetes sp.]